MSGTKQTLSDTLSGTNENTIFRLAFTGVACWKLKGLDNQLSKL
jgi:hypothetical protein